MQGGLVARKVSVCLSVGPSVCLSIKRIDCDEAEENSGWIFMPYERSFSLVFWEEEWLVGRPLLPKILGQPAPVGAKSSILNRYSSINTNMESTTRFPMNLRWSSYVAPKLQRVA